MMVDQRNRYTMDDTRLGCKGRYAVVAATDHYNLIATVSWIKVGNCRPVPQMLLLDLSTRGPRYCIHQLDASP